MVIQVMNTHTHTSMLGQHHPLKNVPQFGFVNATGGGSSEDAELAVLPDLVAGEEVGQQDRQTWAQREHPSSHSHGPQHHICQKPNTNILLHMREEME